MVKHLLTYFLCFIITALPHIVYSHEVIYAAVGEGLQDGLQSKYLKYFAKKLNVKIEILTMPFARRVQAMRNGQLDLMVGVQRAEDYQDEFVYVMPHYESLSYRFFTLKGTEHTVTTYKDLTDKYIGVNRHGKYFLPFNDDDKLNKFQTTSLQQSIELLLHKRIDLFIHYEQSTIPVLARLGLESDIIQTDYQPNATNQHYIAISSRSALLQRKAEISAIINQAKQAKDIFNIRFRHYAEKFVKKSN